MYWLTRVSLRHPMATLLALAVVTAVLGSGLPKLRTEFGYRVLIGDAHPSIQMLDAFIEQFGGGLPIHIAWQCGSEAPCDDVFDSASLEMADVVVRGLSPLPGVSTVLGPANALLLVSSDAGFSVRRFVESGVPAPDVDELAHIALEDPFWQGALVSQDGDVGAIIVQPTDTRNETGIQLVAAIEKQIAPYEAQGFAFQVSGDLAAAMVAGRDLAESTARLIPFTVLFIGLVLYLMSRSWNSVALVLGCMGLALAWTLGLFGLLGWPRDGISEALTPLILVVGVCDAVHLLQRYGAALAGRLGLQRLRNGDARCSTRRAMWARPVRSPPSPPRLPSCRS